MESWDDLRFVAAIARTGSLSGAARSLGVHHATVFRRLAAIEDRMGVRLFDRQPHGYVPTAAGQEVADAAGRIDDDVATLHRRVAGQDLRLTGTIRLATVDTLATLILPRHLAAFRVAHPGIVIELVISGAHASLTRREADVALRATNDPPEALIGRRLAPVAHGIYGAPGAVPRGRAFDPAAHDWVAPDDSLAASMMARWLRKHVPDERIVLRANSITVLLAMARAGVGLAILPCFSGDGALERIGATLDGWDGTLWLLTHEDLRSTARIRALLDHLGDALVAERDRLAGRAPNPSPAPTEA
jgi:DNA-binding transcriptional LysR family regulator